MSSGDDYHRGAAYDVEKQRRILGNEYNDYCAFCRENGEKPVSLLEFMEYLMDKTKGGCT